MLTTSSKCDETVHARYPSKDVPQHSTSSATTNQDDDDVFNQAETSQATSRISLSQGSRHAGVIKLASKRKNKEKQMRREIDELDSEITQLQNSLKQAIKAKQ